MSISIGQGEYQIPENGEQTFAPPTSTFDVDYRRRQLESLGFERIDKTTYKKSQQVLFEEESDRDEKDAKNPTVLTVSLTEEELTVTAEDVVGVVTLLPGITIEIVPKVGWDGLIDMLLTVLNTPPAEQPFAVPTGEEDDRSVDPADVIVLLAINYHRGIEQIRRQGLIRDILIERTNSYQGAGTIDLEQTLRNHAKGAPIPNWIHSRPEYNNHINSLLHFAGKQLLYFLKEETEESHISDRRISGVFNNIYDDLRYLEKHGITSEYEDISEYARISIHGVPRQRRYYQRALYVAQSLLTSSLFGRGETGPHRLHLDYVLKMESLFEDYSHAVLNEAIKEIEEQDQIGFTDAIDCKEQNPIRPFKTMSGQSVHHRPDHVLKDGDRTLAVLDSKYYQSGSNPVAESSSRSRLFTYAYLEQTDRLAFLCPLAKPWRGTVSQTGAEVAVIAPKSGQFSHAAYVSAVTEYVRDVIFDHHPELEIFEILSDPRAMLSMNGSLEAPFEFIHDTEQGAPFSIADPDWFVDDVLGTLTRKTQVFRTSLEGHGKVLKRRIKSELTREDDSGQRVYPQHQTTCIPIYQPHESTTVSDGTVEDPGLGRIVLFFIRAPSADEEQGDVYKKTVWVR